VALKNVVGIDHAVIMVKDLDKAADNWKRLGFTVSPRGTHSPHMGSGNYTIMLDPDYIELLGVLTETEHNAPARAFLERRGEGIERIAFTAVDSAAGAEEIRAPERDGAVAVPSGSDRADFLFLTKDRLGQRYPEVSLAGLPERGGAGLVLATSDLAAANKAAGSSGIRSGDALCVAPAVANGTLLAFIKA